MGPPHLHPRKLRPPPLDIKVALRLPGDEPDHERHFRRGDWKTDHQVHQQILGTNNKVKQWQSVQADQLHIGAAEGEGGFQEVHEGDEVGGDGEWQSQQHRLKVSTDNNPFPEVPEKIEWG